LTGKVTETMIHSFAQSHIKTIFPVIGSIFCNCLAF
jgi:hypothetical protein